MHSNSNYIILCWLLCGVRFDWLSFTLSLSLSVFVFASAKEIKSMFSILFHPNSRPILSNADRRRNRRRRGERHKIAVILANDALGEARRKWKIQNISTQILYLSSKLNGEFERLIRFQPHHSAVPDSFCSVIFFFNYFLLSYILYTHIHTQTPNVRHFLLGFNALRSFCIYFRMFVFTQCPKSDFVFFFCNIKLGSTVTRSKSINFRWATTMLLLQCSSMLQFTISAINFWTSNNRRTSHIFQRQNNEPK